jgi:hypothetical protein
MEAATPLPFGRVHIAHGRLSIDYVVIDDETTVRIASERDDPVRFVVEALEIGARVLDREQTGANAEFVRAEFEKTARALDTEFVERARQVAQRLDQKVDEVFGPEHGHVTKALARHFGDESTVAVQNRMRAVLEEVSAQMREDLRKQFSADADSNPLAVFQRTHLAAARQIAGEHSEHLRSMSSRLEAMKVEIAELRSEKQKLVEIAAVHDKGTAKGRSYEEAVALAIDAIAVVQGDDCEAVGDLRGEGGRKGDVVVAIDACSGPARGRIVFEAKNSQLSRNKALAELDEALETRGADFAIFVVPSEDKLPARTRPLREFNGDKMFVVYDAESDSRSRSPTPWPAPACSCSGAAARRSIRRPCARRSSARCWRWRMCAASRRSSRTPAAGSRPRARSSTTWPAACARTWRRSRRCSRSPRSTRAERRAGPRPPAPQAKLGGGGRVEVHAPAACVHAGGDHYPRAEAWSAR